MVDLMIGGENWNSGSETSLHICLIHTVCLSTVEFKQNQHPVLTVVFTSVFLASDQNWPLLKERIDQLIRQKSLIKGNFRSP